MPATKVKGIKHGTWAQYKAVSPKDPDMLYFITDKGGAIYRGTSIVIPSKVIENITTTTPSSVGDVSITTSNTTKVHTFTIETFSTESGGTQSDPVALEFSVYTKGAVDAVVNVLNSIMVAHRAVSGSGTVQDPYVFADGKATNAVFGHTKLTDTVDGRNPQSAITGGFAVTPKGVYDYVQSVIGGIGGGIVFKGTIGNAPTYDSTATYAVGDYCTYSTKLYKCTTAITTAEPWTAAHWTEIGRTVSSLPTPADGYEAGWEYVVVAPGTYAGKNCEVDDRIMSINNSSGSGSSVVNADWTVSQANISGAVTAESDLDNNTVVLGNGSRTVKKLANGTSGQWLRIENGVPTWVNHPNTDHGICVCEMEEMETETVSANNIKEIYPCTPINDNDIGKFQLVRGAIIFVKFDEDLVGDRTEEGVVYTSYLNVDNTGNVRIKVRESFIGGSYIGRGCIEEGDSACFIYDGEYWRFISIDAALSSVAYSGSYNDLLNKPILRYTDTNSASTVNRVIASGVLLTNQIVILSITYTYGITAANPTMKFTGSNAYPIYWRGAAYNGGASGVSHINPGDTVMYMFDGTNFNIISIDRKIDSVPTSGSINLITSAGVYTAIQDAIDAAALWWEELPAVSQS